MSKLSKAKLSRTLDFACILLERSGCCTHYPGYLCDKDFTTEGVCAKCIRRYLLRVTDLPRDKWPK